MEDERKNYMLYLSRIAKREVSFSDVGDYLVSQFATTDNYSTDFQIFTLNGLSVGVENDLLSEALRELPDKKREILLLFYFMDMSDSEIADLLKLNRSTYGNFAIFRIACNSFLLGSYSDVLCGYGCIYYVCCSNLHSCSDTNTTAISRKDNGYAGSSCYVRSTYWTNGLRYFIRCIYTRNMGCYVCSFYCFNHDFNIFKKNFSKVRDIIQGVK